MLDGMRVPHHVYAYALFAAPWLDDAALRAEVPRADALAERGRTPHNTLPAQPGPYTH